MAGSPLAAQARSERWDALDFWRGYLLCTIFINHVPGNAFEPLTQKNFGFSDSAEGFVFLSGVSLALAFGSRSAAGQWRSVIRSIAARCAKLYGVHIVLSLLGVAIFVAGALVFDDGGLLQVHGRDLAIEAPATMLLGVVSLGHQFGYFNILPMYILMLFAAPAMLWLGRASLWHMLGASGLLYAVAVSRGWNLPTWPDRGTWFFNPFAWQLMMATGMAVGLLTRRSPLPKRLSWGVVAALIVGFGALSVTNGFSLLPGLRDATRTWADLDKTTLGIGRIVHFCGLAYLVYGLGVSDRLRGSALFHPVAAIGRHALGMFALLSLMAAVAQVLMQGFGHTVATDVGMVAVGLTILVGSALALERRRGIGTRHEPSEAPIGLALGSR